MRSTMRVLTWFMMWALLITVAGCNDTCHDNETPTEGTIEVTTGEGTTQAVVTFSLAKGPDFFFTATAISDIEGSLDSGTWTVEDSSNQIVHNDTGVQMRISLAGQPNKCDQYSIGFEPTMSEGFSANDPPIQLLSWPEEEDCQPPDPDPLLCDFTCSDIGSLEMRCRNTSTGEAPFRCNWDLGDSTGNKTQECGFQGLTHRYDSAGLFNVTLTMVDRFEDECTITKPVRVD